MNDLHKIMYINKWLNPNLNPDPSDLSLGAMPFLLYQSADVNSFVPQFGVGVP